MCSNRKIQVSPPILSIVAKLFDTKKYGYGVQACFSIKKGADLCEYAGEFMSRTCYNKHNKEYFQENPLSTMEYFVHTNPKFGTDARPMAVESISFAVVPR